MHHNDTIEVDDRKPEIILHYNATISQTCERHEKKGNRWLVVLFGICVDVAAVAAVNVWSFNFQGGKVGKVGFEDVSSFGTLEMS